MLCQPCQVTFPFYLKYCRQCGNRLVKETRLRANTSQMVSSIKRADIGSENIKYSTSPMTQQMGKQVKSVAELLQNIMDEFPSLDTVKMSDFFPPLQTYQQTYQRQMSKTEEMRQTLREFDLEELEEIERSSGVLAVVDAKTNKMVTTKIVSTNGTQTIEFKRPSAYLGETLPFNTPSSVTSGNADINKTKKVLDSDRLTPTRALPTRLYLPSSGQLMKSKSNNLLDNSLTGTFRQTLNNLWMRMRDLAENLSVNFSLRKNA